MAKLKPDPEPESERMESARAEPPPGPPGEPPEGPLDAAVGYFTATRAPLYSIVVSAPFFIAYELGQMFLLPLQPEHRQVRNKAEYILHRFSFGLGQLAYLLPVAVGMGLLFFLHWRECRARKEKGAAPVGFRPHYVPWMLAEGILLALPLPFVFGEISAHLAATTGGAARAGAGGTSFLFDFANSCGAGAYEELLFRLFLFNGLLWLGAGLLKMDKLAAGILSAVITSVIFALLHDAGNPLNPAFRPVFFVFATLAGIYFSAICYFRSFGTAVAAHASYDIMVPFIHL